MHLIFYCETKNKFLGIVRESVRTHKMITYDSIVAMKMNRALFGMNNGLNNINKQLKTGSSINRAVKTTLWRTRDGRR